MRRRSLIAACIAGSISTPRTAVAQTARVHRIAVLSSAIAQRSLAALGALEAFGYQVGRNLLVDYRLVQDPRLLPELAGELVATQPDLIIAPLNPEAEVLAKATSSIPVVMAFVAAPVELGLVKSLSRPGGNFTGTTTHAPDIAGRMLQVLRDALPHAARVVALLDPDYPGMNLYMRSMDKAASAMGVRLVVKAVRTGADLEQAYGALEREKPDAVTVAMTGVLLTQFQRTIDFAARQRLPALYSNTFPVQRGGLMSYALDGQVLAHRQAAIIDKILKGAKPGDIPVEEPTKYRLVVNAKTARALGLTFPADFTVQVDDYVE